MDGDSCKRNSSDLFALLDNKQALEYAGKINTDNVPYNVTIFNCLLLYGRGLSLDYYQCYSLNNNPEAHVLLCKFVKGKKTNYFIYCRPFETETLMKALRATPLMNWNEPFMFRLLLEYLLEPINILAKEITGNLLDVLFILDVSSSAFPVQLSMSCPAGFRVCRLNETTARHIEKTWKAMESSYYGVSIAQLVKITPSVGVFLDRNVKEPYNVDPTNLSDAEEGMLAVAYVITNPVGGSGALKTEESYRQFGFGTLVTRVHCQWLHFEGFKPHGYVDVWNKISRHMMCENFSHKVYWLSYDPNDRTSPTSKL